MPPVGLRRPAWVSRGYTPLLVVAGVTTRHTVACTGLERVNAVQAERHTNEMEVAPFTYGELVWARWSGSW